MFRTKLRIERPALMAGLVLLALAVLAAPPAAFSQSCALCYTQAASAGARMIEALRSGILILIVPPTLMSVGMVFVVLHKQNQFRNNEEDNEQDPSDRID
ncbi:MAG: hypothetical protein WB421_04150 [Terriglobales bacterium]